MRRRTSVDDDDSRMQRWLGIAGLVFVLLFVVSFVGAPATPNAHASVSKVVTYYHDHKGAVLLTSYLIELAVFNGFFLFFWLLRDRVSAATSDRWLANVGFAGAIIFAVSGGVVAGIQLALNGASGHVDGAVMQTLNVMQNDVSNVLVSSGVAIFLVGTGVSLIRSATLPRWLGWLGILLALASLVLPGLGPPAAGLWVLITSIVILVTDRRTAPVAST
jgi:hypothetical protein